MNEQEENEAPEITPQERADYLDGLRRKAEEIESDYDLLAGQVQNLLERAVLKPESAEDRINAMGRLLKLIADNFMKAQTNNASNSLSTIESLISRQEETIEYLAKLEESEEKTESVIESVNRQLGDAVK
jgi:C4-type Zn-finger protein